jgi:hypothetical protein
MALSLYLNLPGNNLTEQIMMSFVVLAGVTIVLGAATGLFLTLVMPKFWLKKLKK